MALEDQYLAELQNFEAIAISHYRDNPSEIKDVDIIKNYEALERHYRQKNMAKTPDLPNHLNAIQRAMFDETVTLLADIYGQTEQTEVEQPKRRRFSSVLRKKTQEEVFIACLRKLTKSAKRWSKRNGERGYIEAVSPYL